MKTTRYAILILTLGCSTEAVVEPTPVFQVQPQRQWSGGRLEVTGPVGDLQSPVRLLIGMDTLPASRLTAAGAEFTLPMLPTSTVELSLLSSGNTIPLGTIDVVGFRSSRIVTPSVRGWGPVAWPWDEPWGILGWDENRILTLLDHRSGSVTQYPQLPRVNLNAPGLSYVPGQLLLPVPLSSDSISVWVLEPRPVELERLNIHHFHELVFLVGPSSWMSTTHTDVVTPSGIYEAPVASALYFSPRGDRAIMSSYRATLGMPVFDATATPAFFLDSLPGTEGAAFSVTGDTLYVAERPLCCGPRGWRVLAVDATNGSPFASWEDGSGWAMGLVRDPAGPWLYFLGQALDSTLVVSVLDSRNLDLVGRLRTRFACPCEAPGAGVVLNRTLFVTGTSFPGLETHVATFDLMSR